MGVMRDVRREWPGSEQTCSRYERTLKQALYGMIGGLYYANPSIIQVLYILLLITTEYLQWNVACSFVPSSASRQSNDNTTYDVGTSTILYNIILIHNYSLYETNGSDGQQL